MRIQNPTRIPTWSLLLTLLASNAHAAALAFHDPTAAQGEAISTAADIASAALEFDLATGAYTVLWTATLDNPFRGDLVLNLNLGNARVGPQILSLSRVFMSVEPTTQLSYMGVNPELAFWHVGDTVVTAGEPPAFQTAFYSGDVDLSNPVSGRDILSAAAVVVPEPVPPVLLAVGTGLVLLKRRRRD